MSFFQKSVENKYLAQLEEALIDRKFSEFQAYFGNTEIQDNIRNAKEEQFQEGFLRELFVKIFEYTLIPEPNFNLTTELKNVSNSKKADGAVLKGDNAVAVIELKGTDTTDLDRIEIQAFGYKNHHPKCVYVITSNFEKLRFYIQNAVDHIDFNLFNLNREQFALMWLCLAKDNLLNDLPKQIRDSSIVQEEDITKILYADYSKFREAIYSNLVKNNPDTDKLLLFKKTQKLLDRYLFIFFAEDRLLLPPNTINEIVKQWVTLKDELDEYVPLYDRFKKYFGYMNTGFKGIKYEIFAYNGGLFAPDEILDNISIDDDILLEHTVKLSAYNFETDVDVNILGHIFEHSIGEIENVQAEIKGEKVDKQKAKRKKDGIFYTPKYITKYIVVNTLGKLCDEKRKELEIIDDEYAKGRKHRQKTTIISLNKKLSTYRDWLLSLAILDPACGSGAFLNQALDFLIEEHKKVDELYAQLYGDSLILSDITNDILEKNIYGVDLNEESVEIAKLSLWLRTAEKGRKLNTLSNNIKCGNSLIDDPEVAGEKAFNWKNEFPEIFKNGGFDVVIGNPPYVRIQNLTTKDVDFYFENYKSPSGKLDISIIFFEKAISLINNYGVISFISSSQWMQTNYGKNLRKIMLKGYCSNIIDFGSLPVFADADTYPAIFKLTNRQTSFLNYQKVKRKEDLNYSSLQLLPKIKIEFKNLSVDAWDFEGFDLKKSLDKNAIYFKELTHIGKAYIGDLTGMDAAFVLPVNEAQKLKLEKELLFPYAYRGKEITKYLNVKPQAVVIYPYKKGSNGKTKLIEEKVLKESYPNIYDYLLKYKTELVKRKDSRKLYAEGKNWFRHLRAGSFDYIEPKKLIFKGVENVFTTGFLDKNTIFNGANCPAIIIEDDSYSLLSIVAILNSKISTYYLNRICPKKLGGYYRYNATNVSKFPIPMLNERQKEVFDSLAIKMKDYYRNMQTEKDNFVKTLQEEKGIEKITKKINGFYELEYDAFKKELVKQKVRISLGNENNEWRDYFNNTKQRITELQIQINQTDNEIDQMVYELYGLKEEEIKTIEEAI